MTSIDDANMLIDDEDTIILVQQLRQENDKLKQDYTNIQSQLDSVQQENLVIKQEQLKTGFSLKELQEQVVTLQRVFAQAVQDHDEQHATILHVLNGLKESIMDTNSSLPQQQQSNTTAAVSAEEASPTITTTAAQPSTTTPTATATSSSSSRSIPAPSKVLVDNHKKKDNRLVELRQITKKHMSVNDEEAGLRLYKLQKTMVHVVSDLKKYMKDKDEDISKSWKSIDISTQRVAFEMVEKEALSLGVPLNLCIGYWGARRLISKSWANALRTTKKHIKTADGKGKIVIGWAFGHAHVN
jgi:hypothetical protein